MKKILIILVVSLLGFMKSYSQNTVTALYYYHLADSIAQENCRLPALLELNCDSPDTLGLAQTWHYCYPYYKISMNSDTTVIDTTYEPMTGVGEITNFLLDSDSVLFIAENEIGRAYRRSHPNVALTVRLLQGNFTPHASWDIIYTNKENDKIWLWVSIDAVTGDVSYAYDTPVEEKKSYAFTLYQNYPNPFNGETNISFDLTKQAIVNVSIYNLLGQKIETLINKKLNIGTHSLSFKSGGLASGLYFYRLETPEFIMSKKMIIQN